MPTPATAARSPSALDEHWIRRYLDPALPVVMRATDVLGNLLHYRSRQIAESDDRAVIEAILGSHDRLRAVNADLLAATKMEKSSRRMLFRVLLKWLAPRSRGRRANEHES